MATPSAVVDSNSQDSTLTRTRRSSSRMSFASSPMSLSNFNLESPRMACPKDNDAFTYNPAHLDAWSLPQTILDRLPASLQSSITAVQHSGAAVLTGFDRLDEHFGDSKSSHRNLDPTYADEHLAQLESLPPPEFGMVGNGNSTHSPVILSPVVSASPASQSLELSPVLPELQTMSPLSQISLGQSEMDKPCRARERSFSIPLEPKDAYYATELSHLKTEALPRLRHMFYKVATEWYEAKRTGDIAADDAEAFENWWVEKKYNIMKLCEKGKRLAILHGVPNTGMGWCAP